MLHRLTIIGNAGSGKSYLAARLSKFLGLPVVELDRLFWLGNGFAEKHPVEQMRRDVMEESSKEAWIIEGIFGDLLELALPRTELLLWLDLDVDACLAAIKQRAYGVSDPREEDAMQQSFAKLLTFAKDYASRSGPYSRSGHEAIFRNFTGAKFQFTNRPAVEAWVNGLIGSHDG